MLSDFLEQTFWNNRIRDYLVFLLFFLGAAVLIRILEKVVLKDLFSYFAIIFDRPFEVDDFIIVGDYLGVVEYIGIKTTRLRSLSGEQLIFSNTDLTDSRVRNYKREDKFMAQKGIRVPED